MSNSNDSSRVMQWKIEAVIKQSEYVLPEYAADLAVFIMDGLRDEMGGGDLYLPKIDKEVRDEAIRVEFNGSNRTEVCAKYNISRATLYRIAGRK